MQSFGHRLQVGLNRTPAFWLLIRMALAAELATAVVSENMNKWFLGPAPNRLPGNENISSPQNHLRLLIGSALLVSRIERRSSTLEKPRNREICIE